MSVLSAIFGVVSKIVNTIIDFLRDVFKKLWWVFLIVAVIHFFGPAIITYLASSGAPAWLVTLSQSVVTGVGTVISTIGTAFSSGWTQLVDAASGWKLKTWVSVASGVSMLLAPEETGELINEVGGSIGSVISSVLSGGLGTWLGLGLVALVYMRRKQPSGVIVAYADERNNADTIIENKQRVLQATLPQSGQLEPGK